MTSRPGTPTDGGTRLTFTGGQVLYPDGTLARGRLSLADGCVADHAAGPEVDLSGYLVLPGIIDLHGDGFERHLAPRRGAMTDTSEGVLSATAEMAANGIATAVLAQFWSWEGGLRGPEFADRVFTALHEACRSAPIDTIGQLRFETHLLGDYARLPEKLAEWGVGYVVFNDHLPHDRLEAGRKPPRLTGQALKAGRDPDRHFDLLKELHAGSNHVPAALDRLCHQLIAQGIRLGSHDDKSAGDRGAWRRRGVRISEFPETEDAALSARDNGDAIILGAPNVMRGGSHKGNASATDLIAAGLCDAIASDYHYPSPRRAAVKLARDGVLDFASAWGLVTAGPARVLGLSDRGRLEPGLRADVTILDADSMRVAATFSAGRVAYLSGDIASRFFR